MKNLNVSVIVKWAEINSVGKRHSMYDFKRMWFPNFSVKVKFADNNQISISSLSVS